MMDQSIDGEKIIAAALEWLGTPFLAGANLKGIGCDCAGLIEGVLSEFAISLPRREGNSLLSGLCAGAEEIAINEAKAGDIFLFNRFTRASVYHCAFFNGNDKIIHAHWSQGVVQNTYGNWFRARTIGAYRIEGY